MLQYPAIKTTNKQSNTLKDIQARLYSTLHAPSIDCHYDRITIIKQIIGKSEDFWWISYTDNCGPIKTTPNSISLSCVEWHWGNRKINDSFIIIIVLIYSKNLNVNLENNKQCNSLVGVSSGCD